MPTDILRNPPVDLLPRLIAAAMAEEPTRECATCGGPCKEDPELHAGDQFDRYNLREAVGSLLWNNSLSGCDEAALLQDHARNEGAHANVEPRHLAALWEACAAMIADAQDGK